MNIQIANRLLELRKAHGLSQEQLADSLGISRQAVSKWERAEASPDTDNLICLAKLYNISLDSLLQIEENNNDLDVSKEDNEVEEFTFEEKKEHRWEQILHTLNPLVIVLTYLILGSFFNLWHPGWIVFLFIPVIASLISSIANKDASEFCFPVFITIIYIFLGFEFNW